jgi:hypothetical protein
MNIEAITYLLNIRLGELKRKHRKQFEAKDYRKLPEIRKEIEEVEGLLKNL